jgi:hypothetical protein
MSQMKPYRVREGVAWVNGARVPDDRMVMLDDVAARFDLEQGRIEPAASSPARSGRKPAAAEPDNAAGLADDGRD